MTWDEELQASWIRLMFAFFGEPRRPQNPRAFAQAAQQSLLRAIRAGGDVVLAAEELSTKKPKGNSKSRVSLGLKAAFQRVPPVPGYHVERGGHGMHGAFSEVALIGCETAVVHVSQACCAAWLVGSLRRKLFFVYHGKC